ncbi:GNAT family N-acetyltransferase [Nostoc sp. 'Peltigera membranacea cyanobiont' 232]|uniref:GNAT family N-acetyltransferase n=1 Tax=Nostoc sp. 'Peltigera membranacea cyanobiont' 232 TaxID=2014531 RepID=UPI001675DA57|nr:GNAT family N-acetyltransferase [Nostoc sp. 'Peltigera membranacea cyanobiont' 232]
MNLPLETERLILLDFVESDWPAVHQYASDREVVRYLTFGPNCEEDTKKFLQREIALQGEEPRRYFALAVTVKAQNQLIGICRISVKDIDNKTGSIGYCFTKQFWGNGYATEAVKAILSFGFQELGLHRIFATFHSENIASAQVMQKIGMQQEGYLQEHHFKGELRDSWLYAILEHEWKNLDFRRCWKG